MSRASSFNFNSQEDLLHALKSAPSDKDLSRNPSHLNVPLLEHQRHALAWIDWRERLPPFGGILGDDMGLGKTLTMIAWVVKNKTREQRAKKGNACNGGTLVVCPTSLLRQWKQEVTLMVGTNLQVYVHHGNNRKRLPRDLCAADIVVTTYNVVTFERERTAGAVFGVNWCRIILDDAHVIRNIKAKCSLAIYELQAKTRWALTGTPLQNNADGFLALRRFLRCLPDQEENGAGSTSKLLVEYLCLRRTKDQLKLAGKLPDLPSKTIVEVKITLTNEEMALYELVQSKRIFDQTKPIALLTHVLRLQQICGHPNLLYSVIFKAMLNQLENMHITDADAKNKGTDEYKALDLRNPMFDPKIPSTKITEVVKIIRTCLCKEGEKIVVVSQFNKLLQILRDYLKTQKLEAEYITGETTVDRRQKLVNAFNTNQKPRILLLSQKLAGCGLNLWDANNMVLMDLHWNPQLQAQAEDRIYRLGQRRDVTIYKIICRQTVDGRIKLQQDNKLNDVDGKIEYMTFSNLQFILD